MGPTIPELISNHGAIPGIKVDKGAKPLAGSSEETVTEGLDGLRERLKEYYGLGARFTKWRAVYKISDKYPSLQSIKSNAHALARYAAAYLAKACALDLIDCKDGYLSLILYTALHLVNLAPRP